MRKARDKVFGSRRSPILKKEDLPELAGTTRKANSDLSLLQWLVSYAELERNPLFDLKAATPLYRGLLCLVDNLCMTDRFEQALEAPFGDPSLCADDLVFDREFTGWSEAILHDNAFGFHARYNEMKERLPPDMLKQQVEKSKPFVALCKTRVNEARREGIFH